jgi:hypothetical protein
MSEPRCDHRGSDGRQCERWAGHDELSEDTEGVTRPHVYAPKPPAKDESRCVLCDGTEAVHAGPMYKHPFMEA